MRIGHKVAILLGSAVLLTSGADAAGPSFSGTWRLDLTQSMFPKGFEVPKSLIWKIDQTGNVMKWHFDRVAGDGTETSSDFDNGGDSKPHPVSAVHPDAMGWTQIKSDGKLIYNFSDPDGKVLSFVSRCTLSSDAKTLTCLGQRVVAPDKSGAISADPQKLVYTRMR